MRRPQLIALFAAGLLCPLAGRADEPKDKKDEIPALRELSAKGVTYQENGRATKPTVVKSAKELAKVMSDDKERERVSKEVNWDKQYVLVFSWGGSGGDKLTSEVQKGKDGPQAVFQYQPGLTRDLRMHTRLYAVRTGVNWSFAKPKRNPDK